MKRPLKVPVKTVTELPINQAPETIIKEVIKEVPVYQPPQIITKEVIKEVQSPHLIEEINRLTQQLAKKDEIIHQMNFEKIELLSKLNVSEISKSSLINELTGLKEDKADLRSDKIKLHEEIAFLRKSELTYKENLLHKTLELEQLNKMFNESSIANNSFIQDEKKEPIINNLEIPLLHISNNLMPNETVESIYPSNEKIELSGDELNSFSIID